MAVDPIDRGVRIAALSAEVLPRVGLRRKLHIFYFRGSTGPRPSLGAQQPPPGLSIGVEELGD